MAVDETIAAKAPAPNRVLAYLEKEIAATEHELLVLHINSRMFERAKLRGDVPTAGQNMDGQLRHTQAVKKSYLKELRTIHRGELEVPTDLKEVLE